MDREAELADETLQGRLAQASSLNITRHTNTISTLNLIAIDIYTKSSCSIDSCHMLVLNC